MNSTVIASIISIILEYLRYSSTRALEYVRTRVLEYYGAQLDPIEYSSTRVFECSSKVLILWIALTTLYYADQ